MYFELNWIQLNDEFSGTSSTIRLHRALRSTVHVLEKRKQPGSGSHYQLLVHIFLKK